VVVKKVAAPLFYAKEVDLPLAAYAPLRDWFARVSALPAWRETAPADAGGRVSASRFAASSA
jgi:hypothetical protein